MSVASGQTERVLDVDAQVPDRAVELGVTEQDLHRAQVAGLPIDERHLGAPERIRAIGRRLEADLYQPPLQELRVLARGAAAPLIAPARKQRLVEATAALAVPLQRPLSTRGQSATGWPVNILGLCISAGVVMRSTLTWLLRVPASRP